MRTSHVYDTLIKYAIILYTVYTYALKRMILISFHRTTIKVNIAPLHPMEDIVTLHAFLTSSQVKKELCAGKLAIQQRGFKKADQGGAYSNNSYEQSGNLITSKNSVMWKQEIF